MVDAFSGNDLPVNVAISNVDGEDCIKIVVTNNVGSTGDIRGVFFMLGNGFDTSTFDQTYITILSWEENDGSTTTFSPSDYTKFQCSTTGIFPLISLDAQLSGGGSGGEGGRVYNCALEVSTSCLLSVVMIV